MDLAIPLQVSMVRHKHCLIDAGEKKEEIQTSSFLQEIVTHFVSMKSSIYIFYQSLSSSS